MNSSHSGSNVGAGVGGGAGAPADAARGPIPFDWKPQPAAQRVVDDFLHEFLSRCPDAMDLSRRMKDDTGTRLGDWVDYVRAPASRADRARLLSVGFGHRPLAGAPECFIHEGAIFPTFVLEDSPLLRVGVRVDSCADFLATWRLEHEILGEPGGPLRTARAFTGDNAELWVIERHGYSGFDIPTVAASTCLAAQRHLEILRRRRRGFGIGPDADREGFAHASRLIDAAIADLGRDWTCDLFFAAERDYWQRRCRAARVQKGRQDTLGLGWANHDHHTYRSSRHCYADLIGVLEKLGFGCRERFYAGHEAYWGAQVLEQPTARITIFADVDMTPEELMGDFAHQGFATPIAGGKLGTIGLWCRLHGEAFLEAGMHHLECQFDWWGLRNQLEREANIRMMDPFTTFPYLRQCFTEGERWHIDPERIEVLLEEGLISREQAETFWTQGAIGSHLENLERNDGFKGFNQQGVSDIIARTDPRKAGRHSLVGA
jgi:hypothetical protein